VALSADRPGRLRDHRKANEGSTGNADGEIGGLGYELYSDARLHAARAFGLAWQLSPDEVRKLAGFGIDLEDASGETHHQLPVPAVFLVDARRVVRFRYFNPDHRVRLPTSRLIEEARRLAAPPPPVP
jgi:hypothetical protein